ncbi:MAG: DUF4197 domain-containing protein [Daejeonella sp.]|uniref:DUF4197 domain-containing protein n=1 Tax=Daejeonella sp. TaxID=2805397 RepID=UPI0027334A1A|nr:DUF4197 domain-containing protein [Daejeonella sp.]MDP3468032.1 DUF4197 domain-containing protein [Daejeonella sp.]
MKFIIAIFCIFLSCSVTSFAQIKLPQVLREAANAIRPGSPSQTEIGDALKEALEIGVSAGTDRLSLQNGFLGNSAIKLLFPPEARKVEKALRGIGMNKVCDDFILSLNRAAELAAKEAKPIFISAIKEMSIQDASNILLSDQKNAATSYFQRVTSKALEAKFNPVIQSSLDKTQATKYWTDLSTSYNQIPLAGKVNTDLVAYATQKAIDGLFLEIAQEELKIRENSGIRSSPLLKKVFGYADKKKNGITIN